MKILLSLVSELDVYHCGCRDETGDHCVRLITPLLPPSVLNGTIGSLEVVKSGTYSSGVLCSWNLNFPKGSSVSLTWDYIDMENQSSCSYDWVEVLDVTHSQLVYG